MSGIEKPIVYYWDACAYLAWLKDEQQAHSKGSIDALERIVKDNFDRKAVIITSTITLIEVLSSTLSPDQEKRFRNSFRPQDHILYEVDPPIAFKARDFRDLFHKEPKGLSTPDAIHLATAAIYGVNWFVTFDDGKRGKHVGLLQLDKDSRIDNLRVVRPEIAKPEPPKDPQEELFSKEQKKAA